ncbi:MAG: M20/M25/M40 family metallo-hydrolase [Theionarchaea archaeon]|nr:M20/M25/M40 family metallo-hydrolase [Theionarchaea archaeon]
MDTETLFNLLKVLTEIPGPVGRETLVQNFVEKKFSSYDCDISRDGVGNLVAHFGGSGKKTIIAAHACEIGFMVKSISENGLIQIVPNYKTRGPDTRILPFHDVNILTDDYECIEGVFTIDTGHVIDSEERDRVPALEDIMVDIGATCRDDVQTLGVHIGCPVLWDVKTKKIGSRVKGKAMDDRLGLTTLLAIADYLGEGEVNRDVYLASTVQEEIGVRGARALASHVKGEEAYILEIMPASRDSRGIQLGKGPVIVYKDSSLHYNHHLIMHCKRIAQNHGIYLQTGILDRGITDGLGFFENSAVQTALFGCPTLYPHSPGETLDLSDLNTLIELLMHILAG